MKFLVKRYLLKKGWEKTLEIAELCKKHTLWVAEYNVIHFITLLSPSATKALVENLLKAKHTGTLVEHFGAKGCAM